MRLGESSLNPSASEERAAKRSECSKAAYERFCELVLLERIELSTSPLPRECSTSELQQLLVGFRRLKRRGAGSTAGQNPDRLRNRVPSAIWAGALQAQNSAAVRRQRRSGFQIMTAGKSTPKSGLDRRKQALRENLKRRKGALRGIAATDAGETAERPKARRDALKPRASGPGPQSESGN